MKRLASVALLLLPWLVLVPVADAQPADGCSMSVEGQPVEEGEPVVVDEDDVVGYTVRAPRPIREYEVTASFGPASTLVAEDTGHSGSVVIGGAVPVDEYTWFGIGLYTFRVDIVMTDGSTCSLEHQVLIEGDIFATVMGLIGMGVAVGGIAGLIGAIIIGFMDVKEVRDAIKDYKEEKERHRKWQG